MYARDVDETAARLRDLRLAEWEDLGLAALAFSGALIATQLWPQLAVPLFLGGFAVGALGVRAVWRRWDTIDRLAGERDAYVIPEILAYAAREASPERRAAFAAIIRSAELGAGRPTDARIDAIAEGLDALACELEDEEFELDPVSAVDCFRFLSDVDGSSLFNPAVSVEELQARIRHIRSGFSGRTLAA